MSFLDKFFNIKKKNPHGKKESEESPYMTVVKPPMDERFTINFKKNGGKFLYCESLEEIYQNFSNILSENKWHETKMLCYNKLLEEKFENFNVEYTKIHDTVASSFFTPCEYLIADTGSILVSSNQIKEKKLKELPDNFVVFSTTSQLVESIRDGLRGIRFKYQENIPSNITTINHFEIKEEQNFLTYGSSSKNLYLLLLEDS